MSESKTGLDRIGRRDFTRLGLVLGVGAGALAAGYAAVPDAFARAILTARRDGIASDAVLVMIQLAGGNDGLRTVVPLRNSAFHDLRPQLAGPSVKKALPLTGEQGLNQGLGRIKRLWDRGKVAIVQGVGYPDPSLSHFESIRVWETGDPSRRQLNGWLGRTLSRSYDSYGHPLTGCACGTTATPGALHDADSTVAVIENQLSYGFASEDVESAVGTVYGHTPGIYGALFDTAVATLRKTVGELQRTLPTPANSDTIPSYSADAGNGLAQALKLAAQLIIRGTGVRLLHVTLDGFDTHYTEPTYHDQLMGYLDEAVGGFYAELAEHGKAGKVLMATWSEFGRRPQENVSGGTDHGTAAPVLLIGDPVKRGLYGEPPDLRRLDDGNLRHTVDFRSVYQEILEVHLQATAPEILGGRFEPIRFLGRGR
jgi:uncharacterized protein (DUF1501 family)